MSNMTKPSKREERKQAVREITVAWQQTDPLIDKFEFYWLLREHIGPGKLSYAQVSDLTGISVGVIKTRFRYLAQLASQG